MLSPEQRRRLARQVLEDLAPGRPGQQCKAKINEALLMAMSNLVPSERLSLLVALCALDATQALGPVLGQLLEGLTVESEGQRRLPAPIDPSRWWQAFGEQERLLAQEDYAWLSAKDHAQLRVGLEHATARWDNATGSAAMDADNAPKGTLPRDIPNRHQALWRMSLTYFLLDSGNSGSARQLGKALLTRNVPLCRTPDGALDGLVVRVLRDRASRHAIELVWKKLAVEERAQMTALLFKTESSHFLRREKISIDRDALNAGTRILPPVCSNPEVPVQFRNEVLSTFICQCAPQSIRRQNETIEFMDPFVQKKLSTLTPRALAEAFKKHVPAQLHGAIALMGWDAGLERGSSKQEYDTRAVWKQAIALSFFERHLTPELKKEMDARAYQWAAELLPWEAMKQRERLDALIKKMCNFGRSFVDNVIQEARERPSTHLDRKWVIQSFEKNWAIRERDELSSALAIPNNPHPVNDQSKASGTATNKTEESKGPSEASVNPKTSPSGIKKGDASGRAARQRAPRL